MFNRSEALSCTVIRYFQAASSPLQAQQREQALHRLLSIPVPFSAFLFSSAATSMNHSCNCTAVARFLLLIALHIILLLCSYISRSFPASDSVVLVYFCCDLTFVYHFRVHVTALFMLQAKEQATPKVIYVLKQK